VLPLALLVQPVRLLSQPSKTSDCTSGQFICSSIHGKELDISSLGEML
jgi:hypothetical protein